jgi:hypothetical protein
MPERSGFPVPHANVHRSGQFLTRLLTKIVAFPVRVSAVCSTSLIEENVYDRLPVQVIPLELIVWTAILGVS